MHGFNLAQAKPLQPLELFSYKCLRSLNAKFPPDSSGCCFNLLNMSWGLNTCIANPWHASGERDTSGS